MLAIAASAYVLYERSRPILTDRDIIILADFVNTAGDAVFDGALKQALAVALEQSPFLSVYPADGVRETLKRMARPPDTPITGAIAREIGQREGLKAVLEGSVAALGSRYLLIVEARDCETGALLTSDKEEADGKEKVIAALDRLASRFRRRLGESLASVQKHDVPLEGKASTSSLEAFNVFSLAVKKRSDGKSSEAVALFKRAIELDPAFAYAYARLAAAYEGLGNPAASDENIQKAYALRDRVTEFERYYITVLYHSYHDGNLLKAVEAAESWKAAYPRSWLATNNLGAVYSKVRAPGRRVRPESAGGIRAGMRGLAGASNAIQGAINTNRLAEAKTLCAQVAEKFPDYGIGAPLALPYRAPRRRRGRDARAARVGQGQARGAAVRQHRTTSGIRSTGSSR